MRVIEGNTFVARTWASYFSFYGKGSVEANPKDSEATSLRESSSAQSSTLLPIYHKTTLSASTTSRTSRRSKGPCQRPGSSTPQTYSVCARARQWSSVTRSRGRVVRYAGARWSDGEDGARSGRARRHSAGCRVEGADSACPCHQPRLEALARSCSKRANRLLAKKVATNSTNSLPTVVRM